MLKPLRSKILVGRFPLDAPLGKPPGGGGGAFAFCPKNNGCLVPQNNTYCPANMLALIVCPFKNVGNPYACMLFTAYLHQKANWIIIPLRVNKLENWHTNVACSFSSNQRCPTTYAPCRSVEPLPPRTQLDNKQHGFYPPVVATAPTPMHAAPPTPPPPVTQFPEVSEWIPEWMR